MSKFLKWLIIITQILISSQIFAQKVSGDFKGISFEEFVQQAERQTNLHFYYDSAEVKGLQINISAEQKPLKEILDQIFNNTSLHYAFTGNKVFITKQSIIQTQLATDFFSTNKPSKDSVTEPSLRTTEATENDKIKTSAENKLYQVGTRSGVLKQGKATVAGYVRDIRNGEAIAGASVTIENTSIGVVTDQFGYYNITLPAGRYVMQISSVGMKETKRDFILNSDGKLNIDLQNDIPSLKAVTVMSEKNSNVRSLQMGVERLTIKTIKKVPVLLGEADVLRVVLTLPGVTSVGEASTGFNVRGGSADQNLILYNDATIYNPSHFFGLFSAFNPDVIKSVELYKSSIPEKYGGRVSSVLDVETRDGNTKKWTGNAGVGVLTGKFMIEGPLKKDKTSIILAGRTTYSNWLLKQLPDENYRKSRASFYDLDFHLSHIINTKNSLYVTAYMSDDKFSFINDTVYRYGNRNASLMWKHNFTNKFYMTLTGAYNFYQYDVTGAAKTIDAYKLKFDIKQTDLHADFNYAFSNAHRFNFGLNAKHYKLHPGSYLPFGKESLVEPDVVSPEQGVESALYFGDTYTITPKISLNAGLRYSMFNYLGPKETYNYIKGLPRDPSTIADTSVYGSGKIIKTYHGPELRLALRFILSNQSSLKLSYNSLRQYIHLLSNTTAITPTDIWKLSDANIRPQLGDQYSVGYYLNSSSNSIETSVEVYYKELHNYLDYKSGASLVLNHHIETDVINTKGRAYGAEFLVKKSTGKLNGWISYTYSRTMLKMDDPIAGQTINGGKYYPANYDKPHNINFIGNYNFTHRYSISLNAVYSTGRPVTLPIAIFNLAGSQRIYYSDRNQYRIPNYFRMDFSMNIEGNHRVKQKTHNSWSFGVYNLTARKNPYSVYFVQEGGIIKGYQLSVIGTAIPYITYNIKF